MTARVLTTTTVTKTVDVELTEEQVEELLTDHIKRAYPNYDRYEVAFNVRQDIVYGVTVTATKTDTSQEENPDG